jgi:hypothetical protein
MSTLLDLQMWILFQGMITAVAWRFLGFGGVFGSLLGAFLYLSIFR